VNNGVKIFDNPEEEEQHRKQTERKLRVRAADKKERFKLLPAAVKKEKRKAGLDEDLLAINNTYQAVFEAALELYGVTNIRDLPEDKKAEFFIVVDSASSDNDLSDIEEDMKVKQAVGIASDKRYKKGNMTGAVNAIEKLKPGLSDNPQVKAVLKRQNENVETDIEQLDEKNVPTSPEKWAQAKSQAKAKFDVYPSAYANGWAAKKYKEMGGSWKSMKEEVEQVDELKIGTLVRYASKAGKDALSKGVESGRARDMGDDDKAAALKQKSDKRYAGQNQAIGKINNRFKSGVNVGEEVESVNELVGNQHKIDANKNGKVDAHDFKLLRSKKKQPQGADFAAQRRKERLASSGRMDERYEDDDYGSMSKSEFKRREMEHELGDEDGKKRKSYYSKPKSYTTNTPSVSVKKEEAELTFEEMTPAQKAERLRMIARAADRVQSGAAEKSVKKLAKRDMKSAGAQKGMAPLKKDVDEQIQILRKTIVEGTAREKISAYKELNNLIQEKLKGEE
jgi:hypothetical protein